MTILSATACNPQQTAAITGHSLETVTTILEDYLANMQAPADQTIANREG